MKKKVCPGCGKEFFGRRKYCPYGCSVAASIEANRQLREREGAVYEKWKKALKKRLGEL